jgi:small-conductance mechanosensitive channel
MNDFLSAIQNEARNYIFPLVVVAVSIIIGLLVDRIILKKIKSVTLKTRWKIDEILVDSIKGITFIWFITAGVSLAIGHLPISQDLLTLFKQLLFIILVTTFTIMASRITSGFIHLYSSKIRSIFASTSIFSNITKVVIFIIGILIALQTLGISITPILTALGVGGLAVALALQDSLSNLFSGLHIIASRQVKPGDFVKINTGEHGYISDITWRNTTIRAISNNMIIIPNSKMASSVITNYSQPHEELLVKVPLGISYDNDLEKVEKTLKEIANEVMEKTPGAVEGFKPFIRYENPGETQIKLTVIMKGKEYIDQFLLKHEFIKKMHQRFKAEGINITNPARPTQLIMPEQLAK